MADDGTREDQLRQAAERQGLVLRTAPEDAEGYDYQLVDRDAGTLFTNCVGLDGVEQALAEHRGEVERPR